MTTEGARHIGAAAFRPITWSEKDTKITVRQIKVHNEVGVELGLWQRPPLPRAKSKAKPKTVTVVTPVRQAPIVIPPTPRPDIVPLPPPVPPKAKWWQRGDVYDYAAPT